MSSILKGLQLNELSNEKLGQYKKAAGADAKKADSDGDYKRGDKRFSGIVKATKKQFANDEKQLKEFAPVGGDDREPDEEEILRQLAAQWFNGDEDPRAEKTLAAMGWEIGYDESGDDDAGVFLIRSGDINGDTYIAFNQSDLELNEALNNYHANRTGFTRPKRDLSGEGEPQGMFMVMVDGRPWKEFTSNVAFARAKTLADKNPTKKIQVRWPTGQLNTVTEDELDENCWKGYHKEGNKELFGKTVPNCVKNESVTEGMPADNDMGTTPSGAKMTLGQWKQMWMKKMPNADFATLLRSPPNMQGSAIAYFDGWMNNPDARWDPQRSMAEEQHSCPHCGGEMVSEELMNEKKDACYYKVKSRYKVWPSAYASGALVKCRKKGASNWGTGGKKNESSILEGIGQVDENLHKWFKEKWVRFGPDGKIRGDCARGDDSEGKPKCLPQSKAHSLGKKGRASAASRKRREDPNPERSGKAINVNTKKKSNEGVVEAGDTIKGQKMLAKVHNRAADRVTSKQADKDPAYARKAQQTQDRAWERLAVKEETLDEKWSQKYKDSINCSNPKGFSQKAHCAGKNK